MENQETNSSERASSKLVLRHRELFSAIVVAYGTDSAIDRSGDKLPSVEVRPDLLRSAVQLLQRAPFSVELLDSISATDLKEYSGPERSRSTVPFPSFYPPSTVEGEEIRTVMLLYQFQALSPFEMLNLKVVLPMEGAEVDTIDDLFGNGGWLEREIFDLLGVVFRNSRDLRRLLMPDDWVGYPLRRDYIEGPEYHGMSTTREDPLVDLVKSAVAFKERMEKEANP